jgi:Glycoside hydrolase 123, catalytic domain/Glycoside hydrolase 123 N-terminal domain
MLRRILYAALFVLSQFAIAQAGDYRNASYGRQLPGSSDKVGLWWASSGWKIGRDKSLPEAKGQAIMIKTARNEAEAAQLVVRPTAPLRALTVRAGDLTGPDGAAIPAANVDVLKVAYVNTERPTDKSTVAGLWPDPLPPLKGPIDLAPNKNQPFWIRVKTPRSVPAGIYKGSLRIQGQDYNADVPLQVEVYDFVLPDRMTCTTAFGFSPSNVFHYQKLTNLQQKRQVIEKYWASFSAHHISPYDPSPLDDLRVVWPHITASTPPDQIKPVFHWDAWDAAIERGIDHYHFNSFRLSIPGLGGGTFQSRRQPELFGFGEDTPQYKAAFNAYCRAMQEHLRQKGWLDEAYVYWFDEPAPKDYPFVMNGFRKLKKDAPDINRMLTEQVEPSLVGGPNIWCPTSNNYRDEPARERRQHGDKIWWYVCTGPKAPYCTLFLDHPGTELRVWLWQTWQRKISGILVWETDYWTSSAAYPDANHPQNPYADPMSWRSGYSTPKGQKRPWGNGDGRFIYPPEAAADAHPSAPVLDGPVATIRWEMLRDGIEDYEYMAMLQRLLKAKKDKLTADQRQGYAALLEVPADITSDMTTFTKDPAPIEARRDQIARAIVRLSAVK